MDLNEQQQAVVNSNASKILCLAGAGTGKTRTLIARIQRLVADGVDPRSILVLTFTNAAAFEMEQRFSQGKFRSAYSPKFGTFHSFCYGLIVSDPAIRNLIGYTEVPNVATDIQVKEITKLAEQQCNLKSTEKQDPKNYKIVRQAIKRILKQRNLITFNNMCYDVCQLFVNNLPPVWKYKDKYKYILADEYQDTDERQHKFILSFDKANLFVCGDALQSLYAFRGADSSIIKELASDPEWEVHKLSINYRSTVEICKFANSMSTYAGSSYRVPISSSRHGTDVHVIRDRKPYDQMNDALHFLADDTAILCRTNKEVYVMCSILKDCGIKYTTAASPERLLNLCRAALNDEFLISWAASLLPSGQYEIYIRENTLNPYTLDRFYLQFQTNYTARRCIDDVYRLRTALEQRDTAQISAILRIEAPERLEDQSVPDYLSTIIDTNSNSDGEASIYVGTVHSVKGLEFDTVIVLHVDSKSFPLTDEDNLNVYYVAITRAKNNLYIYKYEGA